MLYSNVDKIKHILKNYNIQSCESSKFSFRTTFTLMNLDSTSLHRLDVEKPMYNVLYRGDGNKKPILEYDWVEDKKFYNESFYKSIFDSYETYEWFVSTYLSTEYYKRYGTIKHTDNEWSSEYFSYVTTDDINSLLQLIGTSETLSDVFGKFIKTSDNKLRLLFNPKAIVATDVKDVYFCDFYVFFSEGYYYPIYHIIYTTNSEPTNVLFKYVNSLTNSISEKGVMEISLTSIFSGVWTSLLSDIADINKLGDNFFIVNSLFNTGIFLNSEDGIYRYIPNIYTKQFFNVVFNNMNIDIDDSLRYFCGSINSKAGYKTVYDSTIGDYVQTLNNTNIDANSIDKVLYGSNIFEWDVIDDPDTFGILTSLTSTAKYFNDVIFTIANDDDALSPPLLLIEEL